jgi:hypothetical protein
LVDSVSLRFNKKKNGLEVISSILVALEMAKNVHLQM